MHDVNVSIPYLNNGGLTATLTQALGALVIGVSGPVATSPAVPNIRIHMDNAAQPADDATATNLANAHDPVFLLVDKVAINANGADTATISVRAPKPGAAAVTLTIVTTSPNGTVTSQDDPITLVGGVGSETITALDPCTITVTVKNAANRSTDVLTITAR